MTSHYARGSLTSLHDFGGVLGRWDGLWRLCFALSRFHGHVSWLVCEVAFSNIVLTIYIYI